MLQIQVSVETKALINRALTDGIVASEAAFVEAAVRRYAEDLDDDMEEPLAAVAAGIADFEAGRFTTIASQADEDALRVRLRARAKVLLEQMNNDEDRLTHRPAHTAE